MAENKSMLRSIMVEMPDGARFDDNGPKKIIPATMLNETPFIVISDEKSIEIRTFSRRNNSVKIDKKHTNILIKCLALNEDC